MMFLGKNYLNHFALFKEIEQQIKFPKPDLKGYGFRYGVAIFFSLLSFTIVYLLGVNDHAIFFLVFLITSLGTTILAGSIAGALVLLAGVIVLSYFFYLDLLNTMLYCRAWDIYCDRNSFWQLY